MEKRNFQGFLQKQVQNSCFVEKLSMDAFSSILEEKQNAFFEKM